MRVLAPEKHPLGVATLFMLALIVSGTVMRVTNLGQKHYWSDEALTNVSAAGIAMGDIDWSSLAKRELSPGELTAQLQTPRAGLNLAAVAAAHQRNQINKPPLYFLLAHVWMWLFGAAPAQMRALSALFSILSLPVAYLLAREMGWRDHAPLLLAAMFAVSPFQIIYAQEARPYSLLVFETLLAGLLLLLALQRARLLWWLFYAMTMIAGLFTHFLFMIVLGAHIGYVLIASLLEKQQRFSLVSAPTARFIAVVALALVAVSPWLTLMTHERNLHTDWLYQSQSLQVTITQRARVFSFPLVDLNPLPMALEILLSVLALSLSAYSLVYLVRRIGRDNNVFLLTLFAANTVPLLFLDLADGGYRTGVARYMIFALIALQMMVAYTLAEQTATASGTRRRVWGGITAALLLLGLVSSIWYVVSPAGTGKGNDENQLAVLALLNTAEHPLVLLNDFDNASTFGDVLGLSHNLDPNVRFYIIDTLDTVPPGRAPLYFYEPSAATRAQFAASRPFAATEVVPGLLWQLK